MNLNPLSDLPVTPLKIKRALISVADKSGLEPLVRALDCLGVELISTGGTAKLISDLGIPVKDVSEITQFEECLDGRVKTLHPNVHGGILARTSYKPDLVELAQRNIVPIELVVVNLYPFKKITSEDDVSLAKATEFIDIGGPTMLRAAAKNFAHVAVLSSPNQYDSFVTEFEVAGEISFEKRQELSLQAFQHTADYDVAIANFLHRQLHGSKLPDYFQSSYPKYQETRYGENPHQTAGVFGDLASIIDVKHGKELSYNNFLDVDAALTLVGDFQEEPTAAIFKHTNPSGVGTGSSLLEAYERAFRTDRVSPFGGIIVVNRELDLETALEIDKIFSEIIMAPSFSSDAMDLLIKKKNRRLIVFSNALFKDSSLSARSIRGGLLIQNRDLLNVPRSEMTVVTDLQPTEEQWKDALFAWKVVKHVKSNAIVYAKSGMTLGVGVGQTSRVDSAEIAVKKALKEELDLSGSVVASDAFFPFADGVEAAAEAGAKVVIQPGGSVRDEEVIAAANRLGLTMIFTGQRHFKH